MGRSKLTALLAVAVIVSPAVARAQSAQDKAAADAAFEEGKRLMSARAFAEACPKFVESLERAPGLGTMLGLADCYEKNGQTASAWAEFREAASVAARKGDRREALARENAIRLEPRLSKIRVRVPREADAEGLSVRRDGVVIGRALWDEAVPVDPGTHSISASAPGSKEWETAVVAPSTPGTQTVTIPRLEPAPATPPAPSTQPNAPAAGPASAPATPPTASPAVAPAPSAPPSAGGRGNTQRIAAGVAVGAGVVSAVVGSVFGVVAKSKLDQSNANGHCDPSDACDGTGLSLRSNAGSAATGSTVAFVVAGVAIAGGAVLWFTAPRVHVGVAPGPRGLALVGEW
jgi:hypothetical protein